MVPTAFLGHPASTELGTFIEVIMLRMYIYMPLYEKKIKLKKNKIMHCKFKIFITSRLNLMNYTINR